MNRSIYLTNAIRLLIAFCLLAITLVPSLTVLADPLPPADPPPPPVFCFRITDMRATPGDAEGDSFDIEFEVMNWSNQPAGAVQIALNTGTGFGGIVDAAPLFNGATIDPDGREIGPGQSRPPGNVDLMNDWLILPEPPPQAQDRAPISDTLPSQSMVVWSFTNDPFTVGDPSDGTPLPFVDLLGPPTLQAGDTALSFMQFATPGNSASVVTETIDDGPNALDGFVVTIDDWDAGELVSFNWFLLDTAFFPIGTSFSGNDYGFGTVNLARVDNGANVQPVIFTANSGLSQNPVLFYGGVNEIPPRAGTAGMEFSGEFGASITAPFLNIDDNFNFVDDNSAEFVTPTATALNSTSASTPDLATANVLAAFTVALGVVTVFGLVRKRDRTS